jgi:hypothetical protein
MWSQSIAPDLCLFAFLCIYDNEDTFAVEYAWNENNEFPWWSFGSEPNYGKSSFRNRMECFMDRKISDRADFDLVPEYTKGVKARLDAMGDGIILPRPEDPPVEIVLPRVVPLVELSLQEFQQRVIPIFRNLARHKGYPDAI